MMLIFVLILSLSRFVCLLACEFTWWCQHNCTETACDVIIFNLHWDAVGPDNCPRMSLSFGRTLVCLLYIHVHFNWLHNPIQCSCRSLVRFDVVSWAHAFIEWMYAASPWRHSKVTLLQATSHGHDNFQQLLAHMHECRIGLFEKKCTF